MRIDLELEVGAIDGVVEIQAETPLLQTSSSDLGTTVDEEQIKTLPLNGRNFVSLTRTVPGVLRGIPGANIDGAGSLAWRASASFSANGQRPRDNNYMLDGVDNNETWLQTVVIFPSVDALDEFKLQTSTYSAEFGRSLGGVVNLQIKSGTNQLPRQRLRVPAQRRLRRQQLLQQPGRPRQARLHASTSSAAPWAARSSRTGRSSSRTTRGSAIKQGQTLPLDRAVGDDARRATSRRSTASIYDPLTGQPFPGNIIPRERWDPAASEHPARSSIPAAEHRRHASARPGRPINNYLINPDQERQDDQFDVKVDHTLSTNNRFFARYSYQKTHRFLPATLPHGDAGATFGAGDGNIKAQSARVQRHAHVRPAAG